MKQTLQLKLSQHLTLTPQLQQSIRLLQLSTLELNQELERFLAENPLLERDENEEAGETPPPLRINGTQSAAESAPEGAEAPEGAPPAGDERPTDTDWYLESGGSGTSREEGDESDYPQLAAESPTLRDHLLQQLSLTLLPDRDRRLVALLVDALDDDGYLTQPLDEIAAMLPPELGVEADEIAIALKHLQNLDPTGVGARSPAECLELQLLCMPEAAAGRELALRIVREHLPLLAARDYAKLKKLTGCDETSLRTAHKLIQSLNPRPGAEFAQLETRYVIADVIVRKVKNVWVATLNPDAMPRLRINRIYADILQQSRASAGQMSSQLQEARWLIKNVQQRFETIQRVSQAIVDRQRHFFDHGEVAMRPLVLREIADALGLHESTVSRVTTQKFMATPRGIFELKYFFGSHVATDTGGACSATAIRALIKQLVAAEDGKKPLSDSKISQILGQQGIVVARRTIAKYRESLHIPPGNLRKSL
ncbi:MAG TPA: RNA polymerase factor sigma-54 [Burkholderiales bacterium]|nr:RNA polymerase factor sigma-54 [Burkholderiales bacterium]